MPPRPSAATTPASALTRDLDLPTDRLQAVRQSAAQPWRPARATCSMRAKRLEQRLRDVERRRLDQRARRAAEGLAGDRRDLAVVDGRLEVVAVAALARSTTSSRSISNICPYLRSWAKWPWKACSRSPSTKILPRWIAPNPCRSYPAFLDRPPDLQRLYVRRDVVNPEICRPRRRRRQARPRSSRQGDRRAVVCPVTRPIVDLRETPSSTGRPSAFSSPRAA